MWVIWVSTVALCALSIALYAMELGDKNKSSVCEGVNLTVQILLLVGLAGFLSNIIQFSMDQLQDASTAEITSFIVWYMWTWEFGALLGALFRSCFCGTLKLVATLFLPACVSLALCLDSFFSHWLFKEPVSWNPFKLFFGVLRYAAKNKYPRQRSAFTYWEDKPYSRIDLAKDKYGGPYTTEQVEDVKIVLRIVGILAIASAGLGLSFTLGGNYDERVVDHLSGASDSNPNIHCSSKNVIACFQIFVVRYFTYFAYFCFIPIHEFVIYPVFWKYMVHVNSTFKFIFGHFLLTLRYSALMTIEAIGYHYTDFSTQEGTCFLSVETHPLSLSFKWYCIPELLHAVSMFYIFWGALEFIYSQAPYYMKGLLSGVTYFLLGLYVLFTTLLLLPVSLTVEKWHPVPYGCGVWFYLCVTIFYLIFTLLCICVLKKVYKMRRRDEDLHNRHIFAINYYSHYVQYNKEIPQQAGPD